MTIALIFALAAAFYLLMCITRNIDLQQEQIDAAIKLEKALVDLSEQQQELYIILTAHIQRILEHEQRN